MSLLSSQGRCAQDDCDCQPQSNWGWEGDGELQEDTICAKSAYTASDGKYVPFRNKLIFSVLGVLRKFERNLPKGWKATGVRLLHHSSGAGWNFAKFGKNLQKWCKAC